MLKLPDNFGGKWVATLYDLIVSAEGSTVSESALRDAFAYKVPISQHSVNSTFTRSLNCLLTHGYVKRKYDFLYAVCEDERLVDRVGETIRSIDIAEAKLEQLQSELADLLKGE